MLDRSKERIWYKLLGTLPKVSRGSDEPELVFNNILFNLNNNILMNNIFK